MGEILNIILSSLIGGFIGAWIHEQFRNLPVFVLVFSILNKNLNFFDIQVGIKLVKGVARNIFWELEYTGQQKEFSEKIKYYKGNFSILKEGDIRFLFDTSSFEYKEYELYETLFVKINYKIFYIIPKVTKIKLDIREFLSFEDAIKHKELIEESSYLYKEVKREFKNLNYKNEKTNP